MSVDIIYENEEFIVCIKPVGVSSQSSAGENMLSVLKQKLSLKEDPFVVHRLDTAVSGIMVYAKDKKTAAFLTKQIQERQFKKQYLCVVHSMPEENIGRFADLLFKDSKKNKSFVVKRQRKGVKVAILDYELLETVNHHGENISLIKVDLVTGRTHQIRVQFSSRKMPLYGDGKYGGSDNCDIALFSNKIEFIGQDKKFYSFTSSPDGFPWNLFNKA